MRYVCAAFIALLLASTAQAALLHGVHGGTKTVGGGGGGSTPGPPSTALYHFDGTNGSTSFPDSSGNNHVLTIGASPVVIDTSQSKFGGASVYFNAGTGGPYLKNTDIPNFGTQDYTIDFWVRLQAQAAQDNFITWDSASRLLYIASPATPIIYYTGSPSITGVTNITTGTWYHVAITCQAHVTKLFVNGTQEGSTYTDPGITLNTITIGSQSGGAAMQGWIDELRIIIGTAAWVANFTPPAAPYGQ